MHLRIPLLALLFAAGSLAVPHIAHAGVPFFGPIIPDAINRCAASWGMVMTVINNIISFLLTLVIVFVAPIMIAYSGFLFVVNPVSAGGKEKAREILTNTIVGIVIALSAWLIVDAIMAALTPNGQPFGQKWSSLVISGGIDPCLIQEASLQNLNQAVPSAGQVTGVSAGGVVTSTTGYSFDPGIDAQLSTASPALNSLLSCMRAGLPPGVGRISSISDSLIVNGQKTFAQCAAGGCAHMANSCHYGGRTCIGSSYAVDFGDGDPQHPDNLAALKTAASACGALFMTDNEGGVQTHLHVSVGSCGCDGH